MLIRTYWTVIRTWGCNERLIEKLLQVVHIILGNGKAMINEIHEYDGYINTLAVSIRKLFIVPL